MTTKTEFTTVINKVLEIAEMKQLLDDTIETERITGRLVNRIPTSLKINALVSDMRQGQFPYVGDVVRISVPHPVSGKRVVLDGRTRMTAAVSCGFPLKVIAHYDVPFELFPYFDQTKPRTPSQMLQLDAVEKYKLVAPALRCIWYLERKAGSFHTFHSVTNADIKALLAHHPGIVDTAKFVEPFKPYKTGTAVGCFYWIKSTKHKKADAFIDGIVSGEGLYVGDPCYAFRKWFENSCPQTRGQEDRRMFVSAVFRAWESFINGYQMMVVKAGAKIIWPDDAPYLES